MNLLENEFYDYKTLPVSGNELIDPNKTGTSYYDDFLTSSGRNYLEKHKNLTGKVVRMSPNDYYRICSEQVFDSHPSVNSLKDQRRADKGVIQHLNDVIRIYKKRFPLPYINLAAHAQEGLHRMMVVGDIIGWNTEVPVLVVDYLDKQLAFEQEKKKRVQRIEYNIRKAVKDALVYKFTNIEELKEQIQWNLDKQFEFNPDGIGVPVTFEFTSNEQEHCFVVSIGAASYEFDYDDVQFIDESDDELELDDLDLEASEDFLVRYFGDDWRETYPHLKDTFGIKEELTTKTVRRDNPNDFSPFGYKVDFYDDGKHIGEGSVCGVKDDNAFLYDFEVYPEFRGKGYSKEMLQHMIDQYDLKQLYVDQDNTVAINLYKKYGFQVDDEVDDNGKPAYSMLREDTSTEVSIDSVKTPEDLMDWMNDNITYELVDDEYSNSNGIPTKTAEEVLETKTGHCAEQSYLEKEILDGLGYESFLVMVKENSSNKEYGAEGSAHVFLVYKEGNNYCWFEHSMQHARGIHKYTSLEALLQDVANQWWRYDKNSDILEVRMMDKVITGVDNWGLAKECYKLPVKYTFDISNNIMESDIPLEESFNDVSLIKKIYERYDPPYTADEVLLNYGEETFNRLRKDPVHRWRMETGIELIHKEPTKKELDRIWSNWQKMSDDYKKISDTKSMELFGMSNEDHYYKLRTLYTQCESQRKDLMCLKTFVRK